jgi:hypothetical protein
MTDAEPVSTLERGRRLTLDELPDEARSVPVAVL